jgi:hypothetical protein
MLSQPFFGGKIFILSEKFSVKLSKFPCQGFHQTKNKALNYLQGFRLIDLL